MNASQDALAINPFEDNVVREPREVTFSVQGLNDKPLARLLAEFASVDVGSVPRSCPVRARKAQLVVSPDRGFGKSHLLGRLFAKLGRRATKVYLRPFQDPDKAWHSILLLTIQELNRREDDAAGAPTQLQSLAVATLAHVWADGIAESARANSEIAQAELLLREFAGDRLPASDRVQWMAVLRTACSDEPNIKRLSSLLNQRGIDLLGREAAWLKVLAACALHDRGSDRHSAALKWLRAEPLESDEAEALGLGQADNDARGDSSPKEINDLSYRRLQGLCQLASYHRPFLFCLDQTEFYANEPTLIGALGHCIDQFHAELCNHLTVITANQGNWTRDICPRLMQPHRDRVTPEIPLEGIGADGARELLTERMRECAVEPGLAARFFAEDWLGRTFSQSPVIGVRDLLFSAADHFRALLEPSKPSLPKITLDDLFERELNEVRSKKVLQAYNQDCLMWFVKDVGKGMEAVSVERTAGWKYFSLEWQWPDRCAYFAFEGGDHWRRWKSIAEEAIKLAKVSGGRQVAAYVFRTPDLGRVPRPGWAAGKESLEKAGECGFRIRDLTIDEVCELHAARELYSNALQSNIPFTGEETLAWLQKRFDVFLTSIAFPAPLAEIGSGTGSGDGEVAAAVTPPAAVESDGSAAEGLDAGTLGVALDVVRELKIVDIKAVLNKLGDEMLRDRLLRSVEAHPNLKAHPGPVTIYLQWRTATV
ncbi:MAG: hypothetical protein FWD68_14005 [Alphaproteobacteria bacterium]|nr:hypothetical protein [Alphaproteobacteria bacterium]